MKIPSSFIALAVFPFFVSGKECQQPCDYPLIPTASVNHQRPNTPIQTIVVGGGSNLRFNPPFINHVAPGAILRFDFLGKNHTLTESSFGAPCKKLEAPHAIDTGFNNFNPNDTPGLKTFDLKVTSSGPKFFYCKQGNGTPNGHCVKGMVFAINVNGQVFDKFQHRAMRVQPKMRGMKREKLQGY